VRSPRRSVFGRGPSFKRNRTGGPISNPGPSMINGKPGNESPSPPRPRLGFRNLQRPVAGLPLFCPSQATLREALHDRTNDLETRLRRFASPCTNCVRTVEHTLTAHVWQAEFARQNEKMVFVAARSAGLINGFLRWSKVRMTAVGPARVGLAKQRLLDQIPSNPPIVHNLLTKAPA
jgi:hypothetical protein